jgi:hypothetical protein
MTKREARRLLKAADGSARMLHCALDLVEGKLGHDGRRLGGCRACNLGEQSQATAAVTRL